MCELQLSNVFWELLFVLFTYCKRRAGKEKKYAGWIHLVMRLGERLSWEVQKSQTFYRILTNNCLLCCPVQIFGHVERHLLLLCSLFYSSKTSMFVFVIMNFRDKQVNMKLRIRTEFVFKLKWASIKTEFKMNAPHKNTSTELY